jgi:hypothetical protein
MKDVQKMRLGVIRELKNMRKFFDHMENGVKSRDPVKISRAYIFIKTMVYHMNEGDLTPLSVELHHELLVSYENDCGGSEGASLDIISARHTPEP